MSEWISVKDKLPHYSAQASIWVYDGEDVFIADWDKIDCDYENKFTTTNGFWFGGIDGTECFSEYDSVTHWMEILLPKPPEEK